MKHAVSDNILTKEEAVEIEDVDCTLVLGGKVWDNGNPSHLPGLLKGQNDRRKQRIVF